MTITDYCNFLKVTNIHLKISILFKLGLVKSLSFTQRFIFQIKDVNPKN